LTCGPGYSLSTTTTTSLTSNTTQVTISQCLSKCPSGTFALGSPAVCTPCGPACKECTTTATQCTSCNNVNFAPDAVGACVDKSTIVIAACNAGFYANKLQTGVIISCLPCDSVCGTCLGGSSQDCLTCNSNNAELFAIATVGTTKTCGTKCTFGQ